MVGAGRRASIKRQMIDGNDGSGENGWKGRGRKRKPRDGSKRANGRAADNGQHCSRLAATFSAGNPASDAANSGEQGDGRAEPASEGEFFSLGGSPSAVAAAGRWAAGEVVLGRARTRSTETKPSAGDLD